MKRSYVSFDWAAKKLLRQKSNFVILEGFLAALLNEDILIKEILESETNPNDETDKFNRVDLLAKNAKDELILIEIQNNHELDYFHRMLYGTSKLIIDHMYSGMPYGDIKKVYSIHIIYFDLGQGRDYVYHGYTEFRGIHENDELKLSNRQKDKFLRKTPKELFPEYFILKVNEFDSLAISPLDEWMRFLKTNEISDKTKTKGLLEAKGVFDYHQLSPEQRLEFDRHIESLRYQKSVIATGYQEGKDDGLAEGKAQEKINIAKQSLLLGLDIETISKLTGLSKKEIESI